MTVLIWNTSWGNSLSLSLSLYFVLKEAPAEEKQQSGPIRLIFSKDSAHHTEGRVAMRCESDAHKLNSTYKTRRDMKRSAWEEVFPAVVPDGVTRWHHATSRITCRPWPGEIMSFSQPECPRETTNNSSESQGGKRKKLLLDRRQWKEQEAQRITRSRLDAERSVDCLSCLMCRCWWFGARTEAVRLKSFIKFRRGKGMGFFFSFLFSRIPV